MFPRLPFWKSARARQARPSGVANGARGVPSRHRSVSIIQRQPGSSLVARIRDRGTHNFFVSIVSFHEQARGWNAYLHGARSDDRILHAYRMFERILRDFTSMQVVSFDEAALTRFNALRSSGVRIGTMDLRIAATARSRGFTLLTRNLGDVRKVAGLRVEDWSH